MARELNEAGDGPATVESGASARRRGWARDWRVWAGVAISVACVAALFRGVPLDEVRHAMARADWKLLVALSVPSYVANVVLRAFRWRHLTNPIAPISRPTLYRAQALGFMLNNLVPLRVGELVRCWYLSRHTGAPVAAILGTVVLERVIDVGSVLAIALTALAFLGTSGGGGGLLAEGSRLLLPVAAAPIAALVAIRIMPETLFRVARFFCRPLPEHLSDWLVSNLRTFVDGLGALSGGSHLFWIAFHSAVMWLVTSTLPILAAFWAFDIDLGDATQTLMAAWVLLGATGVAVAVPSVPGFFGPFQLAFKEVLVRFGVDGPTALAMGMLVWVVFWLSLTLQGVAVMRGRSERLADLAREPGKDPSVDRR